MRKSGIESHASREGLVGAVITIWVRLSESNDAIPKFVVSDSAVDGNGCVRTSRTCP